MATWTIAFAIIGGCHRTTSTSDTIRANGTVEIVEVDIQPSAVGRIVSLSADEGQWVSKGTTIAVLKQPISAAEIAQREAQARAARETLLELEHGPRPQEVARAQADLQAAEAAAKKTGSDLTRIRPLAERSIVSRQQLDAAEAADKEARDRRDAARAALALLESGTRPERIAAARASLQSAEAAVEAAQAQARDLVLMAPFDGVVMSRNAEVGEVVPVGRSVATIGDVSHPWVRVYVSERAVPRVRVGASVDAVVDGVPGRTFRGSVVSINDRAEFTPRVALTDEERADLMFGVKVVLSDTTGVLKPGLPVTVTIHPSPARR